MAAPLRASLGNCVMVHLCANLWKGVSKHILLPFLDTGQAVENPQVGDPLVEDALMDRLGHGAIASHLDLPSDLGMFSRVDTPDSPRWHRPRAMEA